MAKPQKAREACGGTSQQLEVCRRSLRLGMMATGGDSPPAQGNMPCGGECPGFAMVPANV